MPHFPRSSLLAGPGDAPAFVAERAEQGVDHVKIIAEVPGTPGALSQETLEAVVRAARERGLRTVPAGRPGAGRRRPAGRHHGDGPRPGGLVRGGWGARACDPGPGPAAYSCGVVSSATTARATRNASSAAGTPQ
ncbi:hypothetical protein [Streptomyces sp. NA13]|uniref:hypothetical protein n=1 Tax=Streptomyces sp. NA13 TaxID=2996051 RepID=UPI00226EF93D|nr:hypothetical protein [Streptomyces sp. NA13]WAD00426.1 hypothetical protein OSU72_26630 [Streptomyces sp. NA13]